MKRIDRYERPDQWAEIEQQGDTDVIQGFVNVYRAYLISQQAESDILIFDEMIFDDAVEPLVKELERVGVTEFAYTAKAHNTLDVLALFSVYGFKIQGITQVNSQHIDYFAPPNDNGSQPHRRMNGLLLRKE